MKRAAASNTLQHWKPGDKRKLEKNVVHDCGWGKLVFAHTFDDPGHVLSELKKEKPSHRNLAFYVHDPQVVVAKAPDELFLDPSITYRLELQRYRPDKKPKKSVLVRRVKSKKDIAAVKTIALKCHSVPIGADYLWKNRNSKKAFPLVIESVENGTVVGFLLAVDHVEIFNDPEQGSSFWSLAVDPQCEIVGVGEAIVRYTSEYFLARGRSFMDLSVLYENKAATRLYEKLGFTRVPVFCVKRKNFLNVRHFTKHSGVEAFNPYARIITDEAEKRGIIVESIDAGRSMFRLTHAGRSVRCHESLTDFTSAFSLKVCDDKNLTRKFLQRAGLKVPAQRVAGDEEGNRAFLDKYKRIVVKPARGEQGAGISVDVRTEQDLERSINSAKKECPDVLIEELVEGSDLRVVVINYKTVAASLRCPPVIVGDGERSVKNLIEKLSRRRQAATGGESKIPLDAETKRCVEEAGFSMDSVLNEGQQLMVRKTANLHTGGTMTDVTEQLSPVIREAAEQAAKAIEIPVAGLDFLVPDVSGDDYVIIEVNERPGLENHQPQPTAARLIDMLFPETSSLPEA